MTSIVSEASDDAVIVDITSDFVCPWCLIGERRLIKAIEQLPAGTRVALRWRPMELNPQMPAGGADRVAYMTQKFGSVDKLRQIESRLAAVGREDGIEFRQDLITRSPNTRNAHRLAWFAARAGKATELADKIFKAYFLEGRDIGATEILVALAVDVGLDADKARSFLISEEGAAEIIAMEREAAAQNIHSVPHMRIGAVDIEGADLVENIYAALCRALETKKAA